VPNEYCNTVTGYAYANKIFFSRKNDLPERLHEDFTKIFQYGHLNPTIPSWTPKSSNFIPIMHLRKML
jgi:hypothetical protein